MLWHSLTKLRVFMIYVNGSVIKHHIPEKGGKIEVLFNQYLLTDLFLFSVLCTLQIYIHILIKLI